MIKKRLHFGVAFPTLDHPFQFDIWKGVVAFAKKHDIHLTAYYGTYQTTHYNFALHYDTCFQNIKNSRTLDGVVVLSGFIAQNIGALEMEKYLSRIPKDLPAVSVSSLVPGMPSVLIDNVDGIYTAVSHLIKHHGLSNIAFIKGPDGHGEAEDRLEGYKKALADNNIPFRDGYVLPGDFTIESGQEATVELLDGRKIPTSDIDAIVASDDEMAMGAIKELRSRGIKIPEEISVVGFDDDRDSATFDPPLSTVRQDFFELGFKGAEALFDKVSGEKVPEVNFVSPAFVPRKSCNCETKAEAKGGEDMFERRVRVNEEADLRLLIRRVTSNFALLFDIDLLNKELYSSLHELDIRTALVGLYAAPVKSNCPDADRTIDRLIGFDEDKIFDQAHNKQDPMFFSDYLKFKNFNAEQTRRDFFFMPIFFQEEEMGAALLAYGESIPMDAYETLRINISSSVKGAELFSKVRTLSITDELTGLLNRRGFYQFAYQKLNYIRRQTESEQDAIPLVLFLDMDGLKGINDNYGHNEGDIAISAFAKILRSALREDDVIGRVGGDEFAVFSSMKSKDDGSFIEARIREKFDEYNAKNLHPYQVSGSIGCVTLSDSTKECFDDAMLKADNVLYEEKQEKKKRGLGR